MMNHDSSPRCLAECLEAIASLDSTKRLPAAMEVGTGRSISYEDLHNQACAIATAILEHVPRVQESSRPLCMYMHRTIDWYLAYVACNRCGIPVVAASRDHPDKSAESARFSEIVSLLDPICILSDFEIPDSVFSGHRILFADLTTKNELNTPMVRSELLAYHFTGGTTSASKCVKISNSMAVHEIESYPAITKYTPKRVLQNSSVFWPASAFGQMNIAIAFKACLVLIVAGGVDEVASLITKNDVDCIGVVPSVLGSLEKASSLRLIFTWGEALPKPLAMKWSHNCELIDLLIATEYWLSFHASITSQNWTYSLCPGTKIYFEPDSLGRYIVWISGPMVTPGYVGSSHSSQFSMLDGDAYFCTNDTVVSADSDEILLCGRSDSLVKIGGKFFDLGMAEVEILKKSNSKECCVVKGTFDDIHVCFVLKRPVSVSSLVQIVQESLPNLPPGNVHILKSLPRNVITGKIDTASLIQSLTNPIFNSQYRIPDHEVPPGKLLGVPNQHRWVWYLLVCILMGLDAQRIGQAVVELACCVRMPSWMNLLKYPFVTKSLHSNRNIWIRKVCYEIPGDAYYASILILLVFPSIVIDFLLLQGLVKTLCRRWDSRVIHAVSLTGCFSVMFFGFSSVLLALIAASGIRGIKCVLSQMLVFYITLPWELAWAWKGWWKNCNSYFDIFPYYLKRLNRLGSRSRIFSNFWDSIGSLLEWIRNAFNIQDVVGYKSWSTFHHKTHNAEPTYACDMCGRRVVAAEGAYDRYRKFGPQREKWFCETCWWGDIVDGKSRYPRIGQWMYNKLSGEIKAVIETEEIETASTRDSSLTPSRNSTDLGPEDICVSALESVGASRKSDLSSLSSLVKVSVYENLKSRIPSLDGISAMELFRDVYSLSGLSEKVGQYLDEQIGKRDLTPDPSSDGAGEYIIYNCSPHLWENGACDWVLKFKSDVPLMNPEAAFINAVKVLVKRHPVFRASPLDDLRLSDQLLQAIALSPEWLKPVALQASKHLWPKVKVKPFRQTDPVNLQIVYLDSLSKSQVMHLANTHRNKSTFIPPYEFVVYMCKNDSIVHTAYIYFRVSHLFADGYCVNTIASDLESILGSVQVEDFAAVPTMNGLEVLQQRHVAALNREKSFVASNLCSATEENWRDNTLVKVLWLQSKPVKALAELGNHMGVPIEVVLMGLVTASLAEKLEWTKMPISLMHAMRDGLNETKMVGYFADYKDLGFLNTDCTYMELFHQLSVVIRNRSWRQHDQSLYDHCFGRQAWDKTMFPVSFNLLPHPRKSSSSRIENVETYWRASNRNGMTECRLVHIYIEETRLECEWAIRVHFSKRLFDCSWVVDYVCRSFDRALRNVLSNPTDSILQREYSKNIS